MKFLGIEIDDDCVNLSIVKNGKLLDFKSCGFSDVKLFYKENSPKKITTAIDSRKILIKNKVLNVKTKDLKKSIPFQKDSITAINKKNAIIETILIDEKGGDKKLFFHATTKKALTTHLEKIKKLGIEPDFVSSYSNGMVRFAKVNFPSVDELFLIHIGKAKSIITIMQNSMAIDSYQINIGAKDLEEKSFDNPSKIDDMMAQIKKFFYSLCKEKKKKIPIFITGYISKIKCFEKILLSNNSEYISDTLKIKETYKLPFAISFGVALDSYYKDDLSLQFLQKEFIPKKYLIKAGKFFLFFLVFSLSLSSLFFIHGKRILTKEMKNLTKSVNLLARNENFNIKNCSLKDIDSSIKKINKSIKKESKPFSYYPLPQKVSSIFSWIYHNPLLKEGIKIKRFEYKLVDYPSIKNQNKKYISKIYLEFKTTSPILARKFYSQLLKGDNFVDESKEVSWEVDNTLYKTSFFIKKLNVRDLYDK